MVFSLVLARCSPSMVHGPREDPETHSGGSQVQNYFYNTTKTNSFHHPFHHVDICMDGAKAMVGKTAGDLVPTQVVEPS